MTALIVTASPTRSPDDADRAPNVKPNAPAYRPMPAAARRIPARSGNDPAEIIGATTEDEVLVVALTSKTLGRNLGHAIANVAALAADCAIIQRYGRGRPSDHC